MKLLLDGFLYRTSGSAQPYSNFRAEYDLASQKEFRVPLSAPESYLFAKEEESSIVIEVTFGEKKQNVILRSKESFLYQEQNGLVGMEIKLRATN